MMIRVILYLFVINFSPAFADSDIVRRRPEEYVPCEEGWYYFRDKCYRGTYEGEGMRTWSDALRMCRHNEADLVSIHSQDEQDFINAFLLLNHKYNFTRIGLNDRDIESVYEWSDGSVFNYTNWHENEPTGKRAENDEDCIYMYLEEVGKWNDASCNFTTDYICEMKANHKNLSPNMKHCSPEEGGGLKFQTSCYHIVTEKQTWSDAERYCENNYNGHLLAIWDQFADSFLGYVFEDRGYEIWIGIKIQEQLQQKWTSGLYVSHNKFNKEEKFKEGTCVARKNRDEWITIPCSRHLTFICEKSKVKPLVLKSPPVGSYCPKDFYDWRDLGGEYCYYIKTNTNVNFSEARSHCKERGGDLVSIHSQEESDILLPFLQYTGGSVFIGLIRVKNNTGKMFRWTDGSMWDYSNWESEEPNRMDEECVQAQVFTMTWSDTLCSNTLSGYICSVKKVAPNLNVSEETDAYSISPRFNVSDETAASSRSLSLKNSIGLYLCIHLMIITLSIMM